MQSKDLNENQFRKNYLLSAYRTLTALKEMKSRIFQIAKRNMSKKLFDEFQLQFVNDLNKVSIQIGNSNYALNLF